MLVPFLSSETERQLLEQITSMEQSGVAMAYDPQSSTAAYILVKVEPDTKPIMHHWHVQGPVTLEYARQMVQEIQASAELDELQADPATGPYSIN
jgi:hypothetical protein